LSYSGFTIKYAVKSITQIIHLVQDELKGIPDIIFIGTEFAEIDFEIELKKLKYLCPNSYIIHYYLSESESILHFKNLNESSKSSFFISPFQLLIEIAFLKTRHLSKGFYRSNLFDQESIKKIKNLTEGELKVASLIASGFTYLETANRIGKGINTVRGRIKSIYFKLGVENNVQLSNLYIAYKNRFKIYEI
jgi:DNA-binding CsgD family transcriptional regulator